MGVLEKELSLFEPDGTCTRTSNELVGRVQNRWNKNIRATGHKVRCIEASNRELVTV
jgi:hypothetical protein